MIEFDTVDINGKDVDVIIVDDTGDDTVVIPRGRLAVFDIEQLTKIDAIEEIGANEDPTFVEKLESYTLPNGQNAFTFYEEFMVELNAYRERLAGLRRRPVATQTTFTAGEGDTDFEVGHSGNVL